MTIEDIEQLLKKRFVKNILIEEDLSSDDDRKIEAHFGCTLPQGFAQMRSFIGKYQINGDHLSAEEIVATVACEKNGNPQWDDDLLPFYAIGNGDYLCFRQAECPNSGVYFVPHDEDQVIKLHQSFEEYLNDEDWFN